MSKRAQARTKWWAAAGAAVLLVGLVVVGIVKTSDDGAAPPQVTGLVDGLGTSLTRDGAALQALIDGAKTGSGANVVGDTIKLEKEDISVSTTIRIAAVNTMKVIGDDIMLPW